MPKRAASAATSASSRAGSGAAWTPANCTRMKKRSVAGSPYCWLDSMLQSSSTSNEATAKTMPAASGHDSVSTYSGEGGVDMPRC